MTEYADFIRGIARPLIVLFVTASIGYCVVKQIPVPLWYGTFSVTLISEWVLERGIIKARRGK